jgi:hypothetical protein
MKTIYDNQCSNVYTINELMSGIYCNDETAVHIVDEIITPNLDINKISVLQNNEEVKIASNSLKQLLNMQHIKNYIIQSKYNNPIQNEHQAKQIAEFVILSLIISLNTEDFVDEYEFDEYNSEQNADAYNKSIITHSVQNGLRSKYLQRNETRFGVFRKLDITNPKHERILQIISSESNVKFYDYTRLSRDLTLDVDGVDDMIMTEKGRIVSHSLIQNIQKVYDATPSKFLSNYDNT